MYRTISIPETDPMAKQMVGWRYDGEGDADSGSMLSDIQNELPKRARPRRNGAGFEAGPAPISLG